METVTHLDQAVQLNFLASCCPQNAQRAGAASLYQHVLLQVDFQEECIWQCDELLHIAQKRKTEPVCSQVVFHKKSVALRSQKDQLLTFQAFHCLYREVPTLSVKKAMTAPLP